MLPRLLLADDDADLGPAIKRALELEGYVVDLFTRGDDVLAAGRSADYDVILLDIGLPHGTGLEVLRTLRSEGIATAVIVVTAFDRTQQRVAGLDAGADDYVIKPFDPDELRARLKVGQRVVDLERALGKQVQDLQDALNDVKRLKRLLPICMYCKSVRDDQDYWRQIEDYIYTETGTDFSHGICPNCMERVTKGGMLP